MDFLKQNWIKVAIFLLLISSLTIPLPVSADTKAGITPDSSFYFLDTLSEKINLFFTFSSEKKAEKAIEYAEERFGEIMEMVSRNKTKEAAEAAVKYKEILDLATREAQKIKEAGKMEAILKTVSKKVVEHQEELDKIITIELTPVPTFSTVAPTSIFPPTLTLVPVPIISSPPVVVPSLSPVVSPTPTPTHIFPSFYDMPKFKPSSSNTMIKQNNEYTSKDKFICVAKSIDRLMWKNLVFTLKTC